jgi:single-stranded DNA-binding protein
VSLHVLAGGTLIANPQRREGAKGPFTTATIRADGEEAVLVSAIAFGDAAERLLTLSKGDALAVSGRTRLTNWTGRDGIEKHGISLVVEQIAAARPRPRPGMRSQCRLAGIRPQAWRSQTGGQGATSARSLSDDRIDDLWTGGAS